MSKIRGFEPVMNHKTHAENVEIKLPIRSTKTACGYDFYMPVDVDIPPQATVKVMTDIYAGWRRIVFLPAFFNRH